MNENFASGELKEEPFIRETSNNCSKVKVALRVRPMVHKELMEGSLKCIECMPQTSQIVIGKDKSFSFDKIFDEHSSQEEIYETFAKDLVLGCFNGYNATILAYGQTGSGKTYTMGSAIAAKPEETGIISRVIKDIFNEIECRRSKVDFSIKVSYLEIYNEEIYDLLDTSLTSSARSKLSKANSSINIREEKDGSINIYGINEEKVLSYEEMMDCLERGSLHRSTASTLMNEVSSRSHAIFTITLEQHIIEEEDKSKTPNKTPIGGVPTVQKNLTNSGFMTAKFHFVDLAGSERIKKTGASGNVMREGININRGLLVLGNVISALTDTSSKFVHVPYRESKLTRILQDSLGGNSLTGMIACVSPAESNYEESLNTIKYANRARNIQNSPHINRDPQSAVISQLKQQVFELQHENTVLKQLLSSSNIQWEDNKTNRMNALKASVSPLVCKSNEIELEDYRNLKIKLVQIEKINKKLQAEALTRQKAVNELEISLYTVTKERDLLRLYQEKNKTPASFSAEDLADIQNKQNIVESYKNELEKLKAEVKRKDEFTKELQIEYENLLVSSRKDQDLLLEKIRLLNKYKKYIEKLEDQRKENSAESQENDRISLEEPNNEEDEEWLEMEKQLVSIRNSAENELNCVSGTLQEKEELLKNITENNIELEKSLLEIMKNQYHNKISMLEGELTMVINEVKRIENERDKALSRLNNPAAGDMKSREIDEKTRVVVQNYKNKVTQLESQLKDFRRKEKEQLHLQRLVQNQQHKIAELASEIKSINQQKLQLNRKYREELEKLEKFKVLRNKEKSDWKRKEQEKELQISRLKSEKDRIAQLMRKKEEEIVNNKKSQELFRNLCNKDLQKDFRRYNTRKISKAIEDGELFGDLSCIFDTLQCKIFEILELEHKISNEENELKRTQKDLQLETNKFSQFVLRREKILMSSKGKSIDFEEEEALNAQKTEIDAQINEITQRIENLEDKSEFIKGKLNEISQRIQRIGGVHELISQFLSINSEKSNNKGFLKGLMEKWVDSLKEIVRIQEELNKKIWEIKEISSKYSGLELKFNQAEANFQQTLQKIKQDFEIKQLKMLKKQDLYNVCSKETKPKAEQAMEIETNEESNKKNAKNEIKLVSFKEKRQLIRQEKLKTAENNHESAKNSQEDKENQEIKQNVNVFKELDALKPKSPSKKRQFNQISNNFAGNLSKNKENPSNSSLIKALNQEEKRFTTPPSNFFPQFKEFSSCDCTFFETHEKNTNKYSCIYQHNTDSSVGNLQIFDKFLFVAATNKIQVIDLEFWRVIHEIPCNSREIRGMNINREKKMLFFSYDNYIEVIDIYTYQKIDCLKARTPEIKDLLAMDNVLASVGKGSISRGALMLWDLRKNSWTCEAEKNADIEKALLKDKILYYGGKEKVLKRLNIDTGLNFYPYIQKHIDTIVSMGSLNDHVITGSKDKTLKLWNANNFIENCTDSIGLGQNFPASIESSHCFSNVFYSGGNDGTINIWALNSEKIKKVFQFEDAHKDSIEGIVEYYFNNNNHLITGSKENVVKMWKPGEDLCSTLYESI